MSFTIKINITPTIRGSVGTYISKGSCGKNSLNGIDSGVRNTIANISLSK
jgi:hypothetical protein